MGARYSRTTDSDSINGIRCEYAKIDDKHARAEVWIEQTWVGYKDSSKEPEPTQYRRQYLLFSYMRVDTWFLTELSSYSLVTFRGPNAGDEDVVIDCMDHAGFDNLPYQVKEVAKILVAVGRNIERELRRQTLHVSNEIEKTLIANGVKSVEEKDFADHHIVPILFSSYKVV